MDTKKIHKVADSFLRTMILERQTAYLKHTPAKYLQILEYVLVVGGQSQRAKHSDECTYIKTTWIRQDLIRQFDSEIIVWSFILAFHNRHWCAANTTVKQQ